MELSFEIPRQSTTVSLMLSIYIEVKTDLNIFTILYPNLLPLELNL